MTYAVKTVENLFTRREHERYPNGDICYISYNSPNTIL